MTKRQENAIKTRQKLLKVTEKLLKENGFNKLSVDDITKASKVAKGTFYTYFKHKEDIATEICRGYFKQIETQISDMDKDITDKLYYYFDGFMKAVELYGINICREWIKGVINPNESIEINEKSKWQYDVEMLRNILITAVENKELNKNTPIELLTNLIITQLYGMMTCWCMSDGEFEPKNFTKGFCNIQLKPILKNYMNKGGKLCNT